VESAVRAVCGDEVVVRSWGGFAAAERRRAMICRSDTVDEDELRQSVRVLRVSGNFMFDPATHRDFLGAILGTGISRDRVGDIVVSGERGADVLCTPEMCEFLSGALTSVRTVKVEAKEVDASELKVPEPKVEEIQTSEASTRLDALDSGDVKVNWKECTKGRMDLKAGDIISCRGKGRVEVKEIEPARKEGRFAVRLMRYV
jgi:RNA-binding protein YlmH